VRPRVRPAAIVLALVLAGCQTPTRTPAPTTTVSATVTVGPGQQARDAFERRDWAAAAGSLPAALAADPDNVAVHHAAAVTATHLDAREDAIREFRWILGRTPAGSPYHQTARTWLQEAGILPAPREAESRPPTATPSGTLYGRVLWGEPGERAGLQLHLIGLPGTSTQDHRYSVRTDDDGRFEFAGIEAGTYKLSDRIAGDPSWRLRIGVEPGRDLSLDLSGDNRLPQRDDFPPVAYPRG
jgi:hypothetical protein